MRCVVVLSVILLPNAVSSRLLAQGMTTAAIRGVVHTADGADAKGTRVTVRNTATGYVVQSEVRHGRFFVDGLDVGGPYTVTLRRLGYRPYEQQGVYLGLGEAIDLRIVLRAAPVSLDPIRSTEAAPNVHAGGGAATTISDSLLHRLPSLNRNLYDFARLTPQVSTKIGFAGGGMSGGGAGFRMNSFLVNGVPQRSVGGHVPPEFAGAESVPLDAVREYQILLAPFDVRYGDFSGALVNAVTYSGTNRVEGSVFAYGRSDALARAAQDTAGLDYARLQYGFSLGGPIRRDRLHFFVATDFQRFTSLAPGPYVGASSPRDSPPISPDTLARLTEVMRGYNLEAGSAGRVQNSNPLHSLFGRLDLALPEWNSRAVLWLNEARGRNLAFSRGPLSGAASDTFQLSSTATTAQATVQNAALEFHTALPRADGGHNELLVSYSSAGGPARPEVRQPTVRVSVPRTTGGALTLITGTPPVGQGFLLGGQAVDLRDVLSLPFGAAHVATLGAEAELFEALRHGVLNAYGSWTFDSIDSLAEGVARRFERSQDFGSANAPLHGRRIAAFASDEWRISERLSLTYGARAEWLGTSDRAPYNAVVDTIVGRRTDANVATRVSVSPRLGVEWNPRGAGHDKLRGGIGMFTGSPPAAWLHAPVYSYGIGIGTLKCGVQPGDAGAPPTFTPDYRNPPRACASDRGIPPSARGDVDLVAPNLRMAQTARAVLAYDRALRPDLVATVEAVVSRSLSDYVFVNLNLAGPQGVDRNGRVLYGIIKQNGVDSVFPRRKDFTSPVIELQNTSRNRALQLSAKLEKQFAAGSAVTAYYTFSRVRDVQTPLRVNNRGIVNWSSRAVSGRHDDLTPTVSLNDIPHRLILAGTARASWLRWPTNFAFYYVGESGSPFTYVASGVNGRGDLNADGSNTNDPIYVPRNGADTTEIRFATFTRTLPNGATATVTSAQQADAFERFVDRTPCVRRQRGKLLARNSCREPWTHTTVASVRQGFAIAQRALEAEVDAFNLLTLVHHEWGQYRVAVPSLLEHVAQVAGPSGATQPVFNFNASAPRWTTLPTESSFQLQLAMRYRF